MLRLPVHGRLKHSRRVLMIGIGGGYDVYAAVPLYWQLRYPDDDLQDAADTLVLANLSFVRELDKVPRGQRVTQSCIRARWADYVDAGDEDAFAERLGFPSNYFPELHLSKWFHEKHGIDQSVYAFDLYGGDGLRLTDYTAGLTAIVEEHNIDTVVLIDSGVDSVLKNDEYSLGTFGEDLLTILAVRNLAVRNKFLMCVGLSSEGGISEYDYLQNVASLQQRDGFLGCFMWQKEMESVQQYVSAVNSSVPTNTSINSQILCSIEGQYGHHVSRPLRNRGVRPLDVFINPLMSLCWFFDYDCVYEYRDWMDVLRQCETMPEMEVRMGALRTESGITVKFQYKGDRRAANEFYMFR